MTTPPSEQDLFNCLQAVGAEIQTPLRGKRLRNHVASVAQALSAIESRTGAGAELGARIREVMVRVVEHELNEIDARLGAPVESDTDTGAAADT